jgi:phosphoglycolate phosphatase
MDDREKGIIFDLDNTLLHSRIDFPGMKSSVAQWLIQQGALDKTRNIGLYTTSQMINQAIEKKLLSEEQEQEVWQLIGKFEEEGMEGAILEEGVIPCLKQLKAKASLFVLTNNAEQAARKALQETGIAAYFVKIYGREQVPSLKPSPLGMEQIINEHPNIPRENWLMIGDSWIDGKAAQDCGLPFLLYKGRESDLQVHQVQAKAHIQDFQEILKYI